MDIIFKKAELFAKQHFRGRFNVNEYKEIFNAAMEDVNSFDNSLDKIKYLNLLLTQNNNAYAAHMPKCTSPINCPENFTYENLAYYFTQELNRLGVHFGPDTFTESEMKDANSKLDQILRDLNDLKLGQQVIYEDLTNEINELKDLYFLGKKKWHQLLIGKSIDMTTSGIVSETISKQIIEAMKKDIPALLGL